MSRYIARPAALLILLSCTSAHASGPTQSGSEFGVSLGSYRYEEPGLMSLQGLKGGFDLRITRTHFDRHTFLRGELRYAGGTVDYTSNGTGSSSGEPDWYFEGRALIGNDWLLKSATLSSYAGLGYRFLFNDGRGITSTGAGGYRRQSNYIYFPAGFIYRTALRNGNEISGLVEYDHLLSGNQFTKLSDTGLGYSDLDSKQTDGYGVKLRLSYATPRWSAGPYLHYWNIAESAHNTIVRYGLPTASTGWEPHNTTMEVGLQFSRPL